MKLRDTSPHVLREIGDYKIIQIAQCFFVVDKENHLLDMPSLEKAIEYSYMRFSDEIDRQNKEGLGIR